MPIPAVTPEVQRVMIGRIISFRPGHEIDQGLLVAKITFTPIRDRVLRRGSHLLRHMEKLGRLPITITGVITGTAISQRDDLYIRTGAGRREFLFNIAYNIIFKIIISRDVHHHGPFGFLSRWCRVGTPRKYYQQNEYR